jgi:hypothetical protein
LNLKFYRGFSSYSSAATALKQNQTYYTKFKRPKRKIISLVSGEKEIKRRKKTVKIKENYSVLFVGIKKNFELSKLFHIKSSSQKQKYHSVPLYNLNECRHR